MYVLRTFGFDTQNFTTSIWTLDTQVSEDGEEGRVALNSHHLDNPDEEGGIALLDTELPVRRARKKTACCMCCGLK
jgi:hypothetical protein